jgi:histidine ammonia-lyase
MGANAATQAFTLINNVECILSIELLNASQALHFRKPVNSSPFIESFIKMYRQDVNFVNKDEVLHNLIKTTMQFIEVFYIENELLFD